MAAPRRIFHARIDSTNLEAKRLFDGSPLLVVAAEQSAGMGRLGRIWQSPPGGLWMSLAWPMRAPLTAYQTVPLAAGLATAEAIASVCGLSAGIKWPNDLLLGDNKLAGVLCQTELDRQVLVVGIGINANLDTTALGEGLRRPPTSLRDALGADVDLERLEAALLERLIEGLEICERDGFGVALAQRVNARLCWRGARVRSVDEQGTALAEGVLTGIDGSGALLLASDSGVHALTVGELQRV